jgi:hypothetical protein
LIQRPFLATLPDRGKGTFENAVDIGEDLPQAGGRDMIGNQAF